MARILIVDDDPSFGELARQRLLSMGHTVDFHLGAFGTLNRARQGYDAVVLDVYMPALDGTRLIHEIRGTAGLEKIKIVLASSMDPERLRELAAKHGADGFISKSSSKAELVRAVDFVLKGG